MQKLSTKSTKAWQPTINRSDADTAANSRHSARACAIYVLEISIPPFALSICTENGFDDEFVENELKEDPMDCELVDFDSSFPLNHGPRHKHEMRMLNFGFIRLYCCEDWRFFAFNMLTKWVCREDEKEFADKVLSVISYIRKYGHHRHSVPMAMLKVSIASNDKKFRMLDETREVYKRQCPLWFELFSKNRDNVTILALRELNDGFPFFAHMVDCYTRCRVSSKDTAYSVEKWCRSTEYIQTLDKKDERYATRQTDYMLLVS